MLPNQTKLRIKEAIVVEGRYDKATLANVADANIIELGGFRIYNDPELLALIRRLADSCGVIVLTDSDRAGFRLRSYLKGSVTGSVKQAYIPDIYGKEKRKAQGSKEGKLGVEGMRVQTLRDALLKAGATVLNAESRENVPTPGASPITYADFYELGLAGAANSAEKRRALARRLQLPERLSADALISVLNALGVTLSDARINPAQ
ncbi:MAG: DUF4093 domain-containing protein [Oscillospiraceae bacterium]|jgi:ribonuclease M5|nr:DUF4093 domain-containing protein [Oscillospiraceae bacterium]